MTNKETVEKLREFCKLKAFCELYPDACRKEECEIYMSIKALEDKDTNVPSNDTISRTDAIDAVAYAEDGKDAQRILEGLVSAIPEQSAQIQDILQFLDERLHPIISPEHWSVYSELHDMISGLSYAQPKSYKEKLKEIADALSEKFAYMNTCLNERDTILNYLDVKRPSEIHCNTDCTNIKCESHYCYKKTPSAQPEPIRINLNEPIKVKLTDWGKEIYYHQYDRINQIVGREACKPSFPKEDENGYTEFQLWCFMELYGEHMGMTLPNVIEPLEIIY